MTRSWLALWLALGASLASAQAPSGQGPSPDGVEAARPHFVRGLELYRERDFEGALVEWERAYELAPSYRLLYNIAQARAELHRYGDALEAFRAYLERGGDELDDGRRAEVSADIDALLERTGLLTLSVHAVDGATLEGLRVQLDSEAFPLGEAVRLDVGRHRLVATARGYLPYERVVTISSETEVVHEAELEPVPVRERIVRIESAPDTRPSPLFVSTVGVTGAAMVGCAVAYGLALRSRRSLEDLSAIFPGDPVAYSEERSRYDRRALVGDLAAGVAVIGGLTAAIVWFTPAGQSDVQVAPEVSPRAAALRLWGRF